MCKRVEYIRNYISDTETNIHYDPDYIKRIVRILIFAQKIQEENI